MASLFKPKRKPKPKPAAEGAPGELPRFDPNNPEHRVLWYVHLRRIKRYGKAAALFADDDHGGVYV